MSVPPVKRCRFDLFACLSEMQCVTSYTSSFCNYCVSRKHNVCTFLQKSTWPYDVTHLCVLNSNTSWCVMFWKPLLDVNLATKPSLQKITTGALCGLTMPSHNTTRYVIKLTVQKQKASSLPSTSQNIHSPQISAWFVIRSLICVICLCPCNTHT